MKKEEEKDKIVLKWLEGNLSEEELSDFESNEDFKAYQAIVDGANTLEYPTMDEADVFQKIKHQISNDGSTNKVPTRHISLNKWIVGIAAIALFSLAALFLFQQPTKLSSEVGQFVSHELPDGSEVELNGNSEITYAKNFKDNRIIQLEGEAFFEVEHGNTFEVQTEAGTVRVLGTSFNVFSRDNIFIVSCKTGRVSVESGNNKHVLEKGEKVSIENNDTAGKEVVDSAKIGNWSKGESYFSNVNLKTVALSLSSIYTTEIDLPSTFENKRFTGSFVHDDLEKALKMVFLPMNIKYSIDDLGKVTFEE